MGLKLKDYKHRGLPAPDAYMKVEMPGSLKNPRILVGLYASKAARDAGETALEAKYYDVPPAADILGPPIVGEDGVETPGEAIGMTPGPEVWFSETELYAQGMTPHVASYEYLKTLPKFKDAVDV